MGSSGRVEKRHWFEATQPLAVTYPYHCVPGLCCWNSLYPLLMITLRELCGGHAQEQRRAGSCPGQGASPHLSQQRSDQGLQASKCRRRRQIQPFPSKVCVSPLFPEACVKEKVTSPWCTEYLTGQVWEPRNRSPGLGLLLRTNQLDPLVNRCPWILLARLLDPGRMTLWLRGSFLPWSSAASCSPPKPCPCANFSSSYT